MSKYFGLTKSKKSNGTSNVYRIHQTHRLTKPQLVRELSSFLKELKEETRK